MFCEVAVPASAVVVLVVSSLVAAAAAAPDRESAEDRRRRAWWTLIATRVRMRRGLTYSERVRHAADRDGKYPFAVAGYRIRAVGAARGKTIAARPRRAGWTGSSGAAADPLPAHVSTAGIGPGAQPGAGPGLPRNARPRQHAAATATATSAASATAACGQTRRRLRRHARRPGLRSPRPGHPSRRRPTCPTSPSSTRTATASTGTRRTRSSRPRRGRTPTPARRRRPSARSPTAVAGRHAEQGRATRRQATTAASRRRGVSGSTAATTPTTWSRAPCPRDPDHRRAGGRPRLERHGRRAPAPERPRTGQWRRPVRARTGSVSSTARTFALAARSRHRR